MAHDLAGERECVLVRHGVVIRDAGASRVERRAAELLGGHVLPGGGLDERRPADEDRARSLHDHRLVAHRGHVGAAGGARAHHDRDLGDVPRGQSCLVEEDPPEVLAVGEDVGLERQEGSARVDEVDAREVVLLGHLLGAQVLLDGEREVRAALHGGVVRDDDAAAALDHADPRDDPGRRRLSVVDLPGGERVQLEERRAGVDEQVDPLARRELAARAMPLGRLLAAAGGDERGSLAQLREQPLHVGVPRGERRRRRDRPCSSAPSSAGARRVDGEDEETRHVMTPGVGTSAERTRMRRRLPEAWPYGGLRRDVGLSAVAAGERNRRSSDLTLLLLPSGGQRSRERAGGASAGSPPQRERLRQLAPELASRPTGLGSRRLKCQGERLGAAHG